MQRLTQVHKKKKFHCQATYNALRTTVVEHHILLNWNKSRCGVTIYTFVQVPALTKQIPKLLIDN